jgi:hypothetical protein
VANAIKTFGGRSLRFGVNKLACFDSGKYVLLTHISKSKAVKPTRRQSQTHQLTHVKNVNYGDTRFIS